MIEKLEILKPGHMDIQCASTTVHGYATSSRPYNPVLDVKHQLPLYTTEPRSRSWSAAGWYLIKQHRNWIATFCPKLILLQRYNYRGPFKSKEEANESIS